MYGKEMVITPEIAKEMLERNTENFRKISWKRVDLYAADMKAGRWKSNAEAIAFGKNGKLQNGQHRLHAVIKANVPITMYVIYDVDDNSDIYDGHNPRRITDYTGCSTTQAGAARLILQILGETASNYLKCPNGELKEFIEYYWDDLYKAQQIACCGSKSARLKLSATVAAIFIMLLCGKDESQLKEFFRVGNTMIPSEHRDSTPPLIIRRMVDTRVMSRTHQQNDLSACVYQAYEDYENGVRRMKSYIPNAKYKSCVMTAIKTTSGNKFINNK